MIREFFKPIRLQNKIAFSTPGETIHIVIEDYVQHLSGYLLKLKFDPTLLFTSQFQYQNRIAVEFSQLYHWHPLMPDSFHIAGEEFQYPQFLFNTSILTHFGVEKLVEAFSTQPAGQVMTRDGCAKERNDFSICSKKTNLETLLRNEMERLAFGLYFR